MRAVNRRRTVTVLASLMALGASAEALSAVLTVNSTTDDLTPGDGQCTLREAIINTNTDSDTTGGDCLAGNGADEIVLPGGNYVLSLEGVQEDEAATGDLDITDHLRLAGVSATVTTVDAAQLDFVFDVHEVNVRIERITVTGGSGGIQSNGTLTISESMIADNLGSGVVVFQNGTAALNDTEISGNSGTQLFVGPGYGGGVFILEGAVTMTNSTVSRNMARQGCSIGYLVGGQCSPGEGGGIYVGFLGNSSLSLVNTTVVENIACNTGSCDSGAMGSGIGGDLGSAVTIISSVLDNVGEDCDPLLPLTSGGHNIDSDDSCGLTDSTDSPNTDPMLGPLQDNGGPTLTHAPLPGSPAIDAIPLEDCLDAEGMPLLTDQRGVERPQGPRCDIGAVEYVPEPSSLVLGLFVIGVVGWLARRSVGAVSSPDP